MSDSNTERNKAIVLEAFDTLFNKRDYAAAKRFWSDRYIQHSAHIAPGREGLFDLIPLTCYKNCSGVAGLGELAHPCPRPSEHPTRPSSASLFKSCSGSVFGTPAMRSRAPQ